MSLSVKINQKLHGLMTRYVMKAYALLWNLSHTSAIDAIL